MHIKKGLLDQLFGCQEKVHHGHIAPGMTNQINIFTIKKYTTDKRYILTQTHRHIHRERERGGLQFHL